MNEGLTRDWLKVRKKHSCNWILTEHLWQYTGVYILWCIQHWQKMIFAGEILILTEKCGLDVASIRIFTVLVEQPLVDWQISFIDFCNRSEPFPTRWFKIKKSFNHWINPQCITNLRRNWEQSFAAHRLSTIHLQKSVYSHSPLWNQKLFAWKKFFFTEKSENSFWMNLLCVYWLKKKRGKEKCGQTKKQTKTNQFPVEINLLMKIIELFRLIKLFGLKISLQNLIGLT